MNVDRLKRMILILKEVKEGDGAFDLDTWANSSEPCGTSCCAVGYAALDPEFIEQGLTLSLYAIKSDSKMKCLGVPTSVDQFNSLIEAEWKQGPVGLVEATPRFGENEGFGATEDFFDISYNTAIKLFASESYRKNARTNPQSVINRIKKLISGKEI